jgi:hypothetical protein
MKRFFSITFLLLLFNLQIFADCKDDCMTGFQIDFENALTNYRAADVDCIEAAWEWIAHDIQNAFEDAIEDDWGSIIEDQWGVFEELEEAYECLGAATDGWYDETDAAGDDLDNCNFICDTP